MKIRGYVILSLLTLVACTSIKEIEQEGELCPGSLYKDCIPIVATHKAETSKVTVSIESEDEISVSKMRWESGDRITLSHNGKSYIYACENGGESTIFYAIDEQNALKSITPGKPLSAYYNVSSVSSDGKAEFTIYGTQTYGENGNKTILYAYCATPSSQEDRISLTFSPAVSVLEFGFTTAVNYKVTKMTFTPCDGAKGYTTLNAGILNAKDGTTSVSSSSLSSIEVLLPDDFSLKGGKNIQAIIGCVAMNKTGAKISLFNGSKKVFEKNIWSSKNVDFTGNNIHIYQPIAEIKVDTCITMPHPRMFFNASDIPWIRENALGRRNKDYTSIKSRIDNLLDVPIEFPDPLAADGATNSNHEYGFRLSEAALLYLITEETKYLDYAKKLMKSLTDYYKLRNDNDLNIAWYMYSQACALCAYDWIYNSLTEEERLSLGGSLYTEMCRIAWLGPNIRPKHYRENVSDIESGCYGTTALPWYIALAFSGDGIDDDNCEKLFQKGYDWNMDMVRFRQTTIGDTPGAATACAQYSLGYYPIADFNFVRTLKSATKMNIAEDVDYVFRYIDYIDWVRLPGNREYGFGDVHHYQCLLPVKEINYNLEELASIYGSAHPEVLPEISRLLSQFTTKRQIPTFPFINLLHNIDLPSPSSAHNSKAEAVYLKNMGQVYMRSGVGDNDTYCLFVSGGIPTQHKHYDNNNFIIYKNGYRALDSGTRPEPGLHLSHYYARTVAHNCITVRMPGETMPAYWGTSAPEEDPSTPVPNDGGQRELLASRIVDWQEGAGYVALSSDATGSYHQNKVSLVERDFIWINPDLFIIFDRVESKNASYPKAWLIHTINEPVMSSGMTFNESSDGGKMIVRTLYPSNAVQTKVGGTGKDFWSDGKNWPLPSVIGSNVPPADWPQIGHWRMEVAPAQESLRDYFLHAIMVGDNTLSSLPAMALRDVENKLYLSFGYNDIQWMLIFDKTKDYGVTVFKNIKPDGSFENYSLEKLEEQ